MAKNLLRVLMVVSLVMMAGYSMADTSSGQSSSAHFFKNNLNGSQTLLGHVPSAVAKSRIHHHADAAQRLDLRVMVPLGNQAELDGILKGLYDPTSPIYHHFLTPAQFNQQFKASDTDLNRIKSYFASKGFAVNTQSPNGTVLQMTASVGAVENTLGVHINYYAKNDGTIFFAPDADPTIATEIAGKVSAIGGLDNTAKFKSHFSRPSMTPIPLNGVNAQGAAPHMAGTGPGGYLAPNDVKTAYNLNSIPSVNDPSSLQNVALFELDGYLASDIANYETYFKLPTNSVVLQNVLIDGFNGLPTYNGGNDEVTLDIEQLIGIAPWSINKIYVYEAPNTFQAWDDEWTKIANDNIAKIVSCSWGLAEYESPTVTFDTKIFQQMAAQGQEVFVAAGDCGAYDDCSTKTLSTDEPSSQSYATGVGISALSVNSDGTYKSEIGSLYGGGGISGFQAIPSYQLPIAKLATKASLVSQTMRNVPDVSLTADASTPYAFYITTAPKSSGWYGFWGSSIAAPTWAAFMAQVNQGRVHAGQAVIGLLNPVIYSIAANSTQYANDFHNITTGNNQYYPAAVGFNDATGLGSFNGANLYNDLVAPTKAVIPLAPMGLTATAGVNQVILSWGMSIGAVSYNVKRSTISGGSYQNINTSPVVGTVFTDSSVTSGIVYYYVVSAVNSAGESSNSTQASTTPVPAAPAEPTGLQVIPGNNQATFSWNATAGATFYNVRRSTVSESQWTILISGTTKTSYVDTTAQNGMTYYYTVSAVNAGGESPYINQFVVTLPATGPVPGVPTGLSAVGGNVQVALSWNAVSGATSYNVQKSTVSNASFATVATVTGTKYTDTAVSNGYIYYYEVSALNANGKSANTSQVYAIPAGLPVAPTTVTAQAGNTQATVSFSGALANGSVITGYTVTSSPGAVKVTGAASPIIVSGLTNGVAYTFTVTVTNGVGTSAPSLPSNSVTPLPPPPAAPTGLQGAPGNNQVTLSWSASSGAVSYNVKKALSVNGPFTILKSLTSTTYVDTAVKNNTSYFYVVTAVNASGAESSNSNQIMVVPLAPLSAPVGLTAVAGPGSVALSWTAIPGTEFYYVGRSVTSAGPFNIIASPVSNSLTDTSVVSGTTYYYAVEAYEIVNNGNTGEMSPFSAPVKVTVLAPATAVPTGLSAVSGNGQVSLSWKVSNGAVSYNVKRSTVGTGTYTTISAAGTVTGTSYIDKAVINGASYFYVVSAVNTSGESANSTQVSAMPVAPLPPVPSAPTGLIAMPTAGQVVLAWTASSSATSYNVLRLSDWNTGFVTMATGITVAQYTDKASLINGGTYYYEIVAVNAGGKSNPSNQLSVVATTTGNYTFPVYFYGPGKVQYSFVTGGKTYTGSFTSSVSMTLPAGTQVTMISTPNAGHKFVNYYIGFNINNYVTNSTATFSVNSNNYMDVFFQ